MKSNQKFYVGVDAEEKHENVFHVPDSNIFIRRMTHDDFRNKQGFITVEIHPLSLPASEQKVKFQASSGDWHSGTYIKSEQMFFVDSITWFYAWEIIQWT